MPNAAWGARGACAEAGCGIGVHDGDPGGCEAGLVTPSAAQAVALLSLKVVSTSVAPHAVLTWNKHAKLCQDSWNRWEGMSASAGVEKG